MKTDYTDKYENTLIKFKVKHLPIHGLLTKSLPFTKHSWFLGSGARIINKSRPHGTTGLAKKSLHFFVSYGKHNDFLAIPMILALLAANSMLMSTLLISHRQLLTQDHSIFHIEKNARWKQEKLEEMLAFNCPLDCNFQKRFLSNSQPAINEQGHLHCSNFIPFLSPPGGWVSPVFAPMVSCVQLY